MASCDSVTVSMAADSSGMFSRTRRVSCVPVETWLGSTSLRRGSSSTSSKVRPSVTMRLSRDAMPADSPCGSAASPTDPAEGRASGTAPDELPDDCEREEGARCDVSIGQLEHNPPVC